MAGRNRRITWTFNYGGPGQPAKPSVDAIKARVRNEPTLRYLCYGEETAPTTGQLHLQGYAEFTKAYSFRRIKDVLGLGATIHLIASEGDQDDNIRYCKGGCFNNKGEWKEENAVFLEFGKKAASGSVSNYSCTLSSPCPSNGSNRTRVFKMRSKSWTAGRLSTTSSPTCPATSTTSTATPSSPAPSSTPSVNTTRRTRSLAMRGRLSSTGESPTPASPMRLTWLELRR